MTIVFFSCRTAARNWGNLETIEEIFGRRRRPILEEILGFFAKKKVIGVRKNGRQEKIEEILRFLSKKGIGLEGIEEILRFLSKKKVLGWRKSVKINWGNFWARAAWGNQKAPEKKLYQQLYRDNHYNEIRQDRGTASDGNKIMCLLAFKPIPIPSK